MLIEDWYSWRVEEELSVRVSEKLMFSDELSVKINSVTRVPEELRLTGAPPLRLSIRLPSKTENTRGVPAPVMSKVKRAEGSAARFVPKFEPVRLMPVAFFIRDEINALMREAEVFT